MLSSFDLVISKNTVLEDVQEMGKGEGLVFFF